jgi:hypothetical protein
MKREIIGAQGEITIFRVQGPLPDGLTAHTEVDCKGRPIISHSESGHHHVLERPAQVFVDSNAPAGMTILRAFLEEPNMLIQDASTPHAPHALDAGGGHIEFRIAREYDPFSEQVRQVAD